MRLQPWRATSIQMRSKLAMKAPDRAGAWAIINENVAHAVSLIETALKGPNRPNLVVMPEFALQGPPHDLPPAVWMERACCRVPGAITARFQDLAREHKIYIGGHQFDTDPDWPGRYFNTSFLIAPSGEVILRYRRVNTAAFMSPHDLMDAYIARYGFDNIFPVVETELGRIGMIPCGEILVPEVARVLMMQGAEVILHPTNSPRRPTQEAAKIARASENMVYIVSANVAEGIGFSADGSVLGGRSQILDYLGRSLAYDEGPGETVGVTALIDVEALRAARRQDTGTANPLLRARWEMYRPFFNEASFYPPNSFLEKPMSDPASVKPVLAASLRNMARAGVIVGPDSAAS